MRTTLAVLTAAWAVLLAWAVGEAWATGRAPFADPGDPRALTAQAQIRQQRPFARSPAPTSSPAPLAYLQVALLQLAEHSLDVAVLATHEVPLAPDGAFDVSLRFLDASVGAWSGRRLHAADLLARPLAANAHRVVREQRLPWSFRRTSAGARVQGRYLGGDGGRHRLQLTPVGRDPGANERRADQQLPERLELPDGGMAASGFGDDGTVLLLRVTAGPCAASATATAASWHQAARVACVSLDPAAAADGFAAVAALAFADRELAAAVRRGPMESAAAKWGAARTDAAGELPPWCVGWRALWLQDRAEEAQSVAAALEKDVWLQLRHLPAAGLVPVPDGEVGTAWERLRTLGARGEWPSLWPRGDAARAAWAAIPFVLAAAFAWWRRARTAAGSGVPWSTMSVLSVAGMVEVGGLLGAVFVAVWAGSAWRRLSRATPSWQRLSIAVALAAAILWPLRWFGAYPDLAVPDAIAGLGRTGCWLVVGWWLLEDRAWRAPAAYAVFLAALVLRGASMLAFRCGASADAVEVIAVGSLIVALAGLGAFLLFGRRRTVVEAPAAALSPASV